MVTIKEKLANKENFGNSRSTANIRYIVIHYTSNDGDTDESNGKYFANNVVKASAHYFVDDDSITQSVPDNYSAWAVGGNKYASCSRTGGGKYHNICKNSNSLSIEICDDVRNGTVYPSAKTIENALELTKMLMKKYNVPVSKVIRHFDVTGKLCPAYWCGTAEKDKKWKTEFWDKLTGQASTTTEVKNTASTVKVDPARYKNSTYNKTYTVTASALNMRAGAGTGKEVLTTLPKGTKFRCYGYFNKLSDGSIWLYGISNGKTGYCSKSYLK